MRPQRHVLLVSTLIFAAWLLWGVSMQAEDGPSLQTQISETIQNVKTGKTATIRADAARHLTEITHRKNLNAVDDATLSTLASLLDSHEIPVVVWVAACLGDFGQRARFAVPKLEKILVETDCDRGISPRMSIEPALKRIGVKPPPPHCDSSPMER
jgi:hypothetical protein